MILNSDHLAILQSCLERLQSGFDELPTLPSPDFQQGWVEALLRTAERLHDNHPYHHPLYVGQMLKPPHPVSHLAYTLAMCLNPNNHALDGGRASSAMEKECVAALGEMLGYPSGMAHLCGGGTMANFEALWIAKNDTGGKSVAVSEHAHYTHKRLCEVLDVDCYPIPVDRQGRMDLQCLDEMLRELPIGTVVATTGTTGLGAVDPVREIIELRHEKEYAFRLHVDAAYGGFFSLVETLDPAVRSAFQLMDYVDSLVIDPHKQGLQPYGCGCVMFLDRSVSQYYLHESPYTYFTSETGHLGEISLECSRAGAAAVALWTTLQCFPLVSDGELARDLGRSCEAAKTFAEWLRTQPRCVPVVDPQLDIVVWAITARTSSESSELAQRIFAAAEQQQLHLAQLKLDSHFLAPLRLVEDWDSDTLTCLRVCLMKPEHADWLPTILERLEAAQRQVLSSAI